jgi:murein DD-endopeptidase MepM/ murein hydrolase activator NlpD
MVLKKLFSALGLNNSWNYSKNRSLLVTNIALLVLALCAGVSHYTSRAGTPPPSPDVHATTQLQPVPQTSIERFEGQIKKNMTLSDVLTAYDLSHEMIHQLVVVTKPIYNLRTLIAGNRFELEKLPDGTLKTFTYAVDLDKYVEVSLTEKGYQAAIKPFEYETQQALISGTIQSSLFQTMNELNERDQLALDIAETFSYDIDFNSELRSGDHFKVAIEKQYQNGEFVKYGRILAAELSNRGRVYSAFYFTDPQGRSEYYDARGRALKRDLLKSPVKFSRVSSRFSRRRFHPVLGIFRPHLGIDYAAPVGTPVYAAGSGRVQFAGWNRGFGKYVQIKHGNEYTTTYGHLSKYAAGVRTGATVKQGQVIGHVGATGLATGPHLDYRIARRGVFVNPLSVKFQPSVHLRAEYYTAFDAKKQEWQEQFVRLDFSRFSQQVVALGPRSPQASPQPPIDARN